MDVIQQLDSDLNQSLKEKNELVVLTLRQIKTALTNAEIVKKREKLTTDEVIKILRLEVKRRKEAAELYQKGGRPELAEKENKEIEIVNKYLPAELSEEIIKQKVGEAIKKTNAASLADMGKVIGLVMKELGASADGAVVSRLAKEELLNKK